MKNFAIAVLCSFGMVTTALGQDCPPVMMQPCCVAMVSPCEMSATAIYCMGPVIQEPTPARPPELTSVVVQEESAAAPSSVLSSPAPEVAVSPESTSTVGLEVRSGSRRTGNNAGMRRRSGVLGRFFNRFR